MFLEIAGNWEMLNDNLLDLSHLGDVHRRTTGGDPDTHANADMKTTTSDGGGGFVRRWLANSQPPPFDRLGCDFAGAIDRWQEIDVVPGLIRISTTASMRTRARPKAGTLGACT